MSKSVWLSTEPRDTPQARRMWDDKELEAFI